MALAAGADRAEPEDDGAEDAVEGSDEDGADDGIAKGLMYVVGLDWWVVTLFVIGV